jgi:hypothetical protein
VISIPEFCLVDSSDYLLNRGMEDSQADRCFCGSWAQAAREPLALFLPLPV